MQIWRYAEQGSIRLLWILGTNPAVSLPELGRVRAILEANEPFVVVQDAFLTETARLADVVLPAALWGEKTGTFTNADRTVHLSERAVDPPGEARPDLDIFLKLEEPERLHSELFAGTRQGGLGLLRDLHDLYLMATECEVTAALVGQAAQGARDADLLDAVERCRGEVAQQLKWLRTRMKQAALQALVVAD
jgi:NADH dehydrogenase/NADH:ubiquinone oxidoreductase subunit G